MSNLRTPIIIEGRGFDWDDGKKWASQVQDSDGEINWKAAFFADPGVAQCPYCSVYYWNEGEFVQCLDCGERWHTTNRREKCGNLGSDGRCAGHLVKS